MNTKMSDWKEMPVSVRYYYNDFQQRAFSNLSNEPIGEQISDKAFRIDDKYFVGSLKRVIADYSKLNPTAKLIIWVIDNGYTELVKDAYVVRKFWTLDNKEFKI